jgi:hypothetical protein
MLKVDRRNPMLGTIAFINGLGRCAMKKNKTITK